MSALGYHLSKVLDFNNILSNLPFDKSKINVLEYSTKSNQKYKIVRYDKEILTFDLIDTYGLFRSVILNNENCVVCFAPPKSFSYETFIEKYKESENHFENIVAEEFVEGTMINLFWDPSIGLYGSWEISTRNTVSANVSFYKTSDGKTFNSMFMEACSVNQLDINKLDKGYCYSFVLQHPENRIVIPFTKAQLYLVEIYQIVTYTNINANEIIVYPQNIRNYLQYGFQDSLVKIPERYTWTSYKNLKQTYTSHNTGYDILGIIIKNIETGERCKIRNPVYEEIRRLKGNQPKLQYQYLCLRQQGKMRDFLKYYPENKADFSKFREQMHAFTNTLFQNYISCYINKVKPLKDFPLPFRNHMFQLHKLYLDELKEKKQYVTNTVVIKYMNDLHPSQQMYSLNYNMRKRMVDFIKVDSEQEQHEQ